MVEIGGEVRVAGKRSSASMWKIGVESPTFDQRRVETVLAVPRGAIASSGDYRDYFEHDGKRYSHTIDPRSGRPIDHECGAVRNARQVGMDFTDQRHRNLISR